MCVFVVAAVHATTQVRLIRRSPVLAVRATVGSCTRASASDLAARIASAAPASSEGKVFESLGVEPRGRVLALFTFCPRGRPVSDGPVAAVHHLDA